MKIAFDAKRFFHNTSGLGNYSRDLLRILSEYEPDNEYILLNKNKSERGKEILERSNVKFAQTSKGNFSRQLKMGKDAQKLGADIFHGLSGELPLKWDQKPIKKVVTIHDLIFVRYPQYYSFFDRKIHFWKFKKAAETADKIIAISEQTKRDIIDFLKIPETKIDVIYQGCHKAFKEEQSPELIQAAKEKFNLPERFILNVGTIEDRKNLLNIVVVTSNTSCLPEAGGKDSVYIDPDNYLDLKAKIKFLWENESERKRREEKGFTFVQKFNDEPIARELMHFYQKII